MTAMILTTNTNVQNGDRSVVAQTAPGKKGTLDDAKNDNQNEGVTTIDRDQDRHDKLQLVLKEISKLCDDGSEFETLREIGKSIRDDGDRLCGDNIAGGYTNFSFKIYLENSPSTAVFAKACFPYALWSPDTSVHHDLSRVESEFDLMRRYMDELRTTSHTNKGSSKEDGSSETMSVVPMPYHLIKVTDELYIFVAEWVAPTDEQWGNQFVDGHVDGRVIEVAAKTMARINLSHFDDDVNQGCADSMHDIAMGFDELFLDIIDKPKKNDRCAEYAKSQIGLDRMAKIIQEWRRVDEIKECMSHSDAHVFNMLVESKPDPSNLTHFGDNGSFFLCDWEMARAGPKGRDFGLFLAFPIMSAMFLAGKGQIEEALATLQHLKDFWNIYQRTLVDEGNKNQQYLKEAFRCAIGYEGWFSVFAFYLINAMVDANDLDAFTEEGKDEILASVGLTGLKCIDIGLMNDRGAEEMSLDELHSFFFQLMEDELQFLYGRVHSVRSERQRRRSSLLRATGRRLSDSQEFGLLVRRASAIVHPELL